MEYIVTKTIPTNELKEYGDYIDFLFKNENGIYNICMTEEEVEKSNKWFKNMPLHTIVVSNDKLEVGDKFLGLAVNSELNGRIFKYIGPTEGGVDLINIEDKDGNMHVSTIHLLEGSYKFIRIANMQDKEQVVRGVISQLEF